MAAKPARSRPTVPPLASRPAAGGDSGLRKAFRDNAADACIPAGASSETLSRVLGIPVLVFYLDELPHGFKKPEDIRHFTRDESHQRAEWLMRRIRRLGGASALAAARSGKALDDDAWESDAWKEIAADIGRLADGPFMQSRSLPASPRRKRAGGVFLRLPGKNVATEAVVFGPDRRWTAQQHWQWLTYLKPGQVERWPSGAADRSAPLRPVAEADAKAAFMHYIFTHEVGHVVQREAEPEGFHRRWLAERDADRFAFSQMRALAGAKGQTPAFSAALQSTMGAVIKARALGAFLGSDSEYSFADALAPESEARVFAALAARKLQPVATATPRPPRSAHRRLPPPTLLRKIFKTEAPQNVIPDEARLAEACRDAVCELQMRVWCRLNARALCWTSAEIQAAIPLWRKGQLANAPLNALLTAADKGWTEIAGAPEIALPALRAALSAQSGASALNDPLVRQSAALILAAAHYFCPSLLRKAPLAQRTGVRKQAAKPHAPQASSVVAPPRPRRHFAAPSILSGNSRRFAA